MDRLLGRGTDRSETAALAADQAASLQRSSFIYIVLGTLTSTFYTLNYTAGALRDGARPSISLLGSYAAILVCYAFFGAFSLRLHKPWTDRQYIQRMTVGFVVLGLCWGIFCQSLAIASTSAQRISVVGLLVAIIATTILGVPLRIAMSFFVPTVISGTIILLDTFAPVDSGAIAAYGGFCLFAIAGTVYTNRSLVERSRSRLAIQRDKETIDVFLREYEEGSNDWLWQTDPGHRLVRMPGRPWEARRRPGFPLGRTFEELALPLLDAQSLAASNLPRLLSLMRNRTPFRDLHLLVEMGGGPVWVSLTGHPVYDADGRFGGYRGLATDITEKKVAQSQLEFLAEHDDLTLLLKRKAFVDRARGTLPRSSRGVAMLLLDLDDFKLINDQLGHLVGDEALRQTAQVVVDCTGAADLRARLGGDEFAICLVDAQAERAKDVARRIQAALGKCQPDKYLGDPLSTSIGIAIHPEHGTNVEALLRAADLALYQAKGAGKGCHSVYDSWMEFKHAGWARLRTELGRAVENDEIVLEYQPIVDIVSGAVVLMEALARWNHPTRGRLAARDFIPDAEASGAIQELGAAVLHAACRDAVTWNNLAPVAVNVSAKQLRLTDFPRLVERALEESGLPADRLVLEITETAFVGDGRHAMVQLAAVRRLGVAVVLDDFGSGYSSMTYLRRFDVDGLKIDKSFTQELPGSAKVAAIVRSLVQLASELNVYLIAEGVETREQLAWLRENHVTFGQGHLFARPAALSTSYLAPDRTPF